MAATLEQLAALLAESAFLQPFGFVIESCAPGECTVRVPYAAWLDRPGGIISGITIMGAADVTMWLAIHTRRGLDEQWLTTDLKTAFLRSARGSDVICNARVLKLGRRTAYGTAECRTPDGVLLSHHVLTYALAAGARE